MNRRYSLRKQIRKGSGWNIGAAIFGLALIAAVDCVGQGGGDLWLMKGHDTRRTGQSGSLGPVQVSAAASWKVDIPAKNVINIGASVDRTGVYFGTWGLQRNPQGSNDPRTWDKYDGALHGYRLDGTPLWGDGQVRLDLVPRCYELEGREKDGNDVIWCGLLNAYHVTFYNGTVEGQGAIDTARNRMYVGRGDGKLYAINPNTGEIAWRYTTFNPKFPTDPDGGGEIVTSPLYDANGAIYFGTWGEGTYETNAIYALNPDGTLRWRFPSDSSLTHRFFASPALSPDGSTLYFSEFTDRDSLTRPGTLYAFHRLSESGLPDPSRLKWKMELSLAGDPIIANTMAVGADGTIYVGGSVLRDNVNIPVIVAVRDNGGNGSPAWSGGYVELHDDAQFVLGIGLREVEGITERLYVTTSSNGSNVFNWKPEGKIYALDPAAGEVLAGYDPSDDVSTAIGGMNSPAIDAEGRIFVGVRGHYRGLLAPERAPGYYFGLDYDPVAQRFVYLWSYQTDDNYVEWTHPAIGPDGGIYAGSAANGPVDSVYTALHAPDAVPDGTTPKFYAIKGGTTSVEGKEMADATILEPAQPNPFSGRTRIRFTLPRSMDVQLRITDPLGREVGAPTIGRLNAGEHHSIFDAGELASGTYFIHLVADGAERTEKVVVWR